MSSSVFLAPCDPENFDRTVRTAVDLGEYPDHPGDLPETEAVRFWGAREGSRNRSNFRRMEPDDLVLFYQDGGYVGCGRVGTLLEDDEEWASTTFWDGAPSTLLYTVEEFVSVAVPREAVNVVFGYAPGYVPQGLMRVAETKLQNRPAAIKRALELYTER